MKNFDWTCFTKKGAVKTDLKTIYDAWTIPQELEKWFLKSAAYFDEQGKEISRDSNYSGNHTYEWMWYNYDKTEKGDVIEANGKDKVIFTFAGGCIVEVTLKEMNDHVIISITQKEIPTDDESKLNKRLGCSDGWAYFLMNIKSVYESGHDLRVKDNQLHQLMYG